MRTRETQVFSSNRSCREISVTSKLSGNKRISFKKASIYKSKSIRGQYYLSSVKMLRRQRRESEALTTAHRFRMSDL